MAVCNQKSIFLLAVLVNLSYCSPAQSPPKKANYYEYFLNKCPEIRQLCTPISDFDKELFLIKCLQQDPSKIAGLSLNCQYTVSKFVYYINDPQTLETKLNDHECVNKEFHECLKLEDGTLDCLFTKSNKGHAACQNFLRSLQEVWKNINRIQTIFISDCINDIEKFNCAADAAKSVTILECLNINKKTLSDNCLNRVDLLITSKYSTEPESARLYEACDKESDQFCKSHMDASELFLCLTSRRGDGQFSQKCITELTRQFNSMTNRNTKVLARVCRDDIRTYKCRKGASDNKDIRAAQILLCLEGAIRNRSTVDQECRKELINHRTKLLRDYKLSPEIVSDCSDDIIKLCNHVGANGATIHCLMDHVRPNRKKTVSIKCRRALEDLIKATDPGEDWRVDPVLHDACSSVVDVACRDIRSGGARVMNCLIDKIGSTYMTESCENAVMQIQYFVARDFQLDPQLYDKCRADAVKYCHASPDWEDFGEKNSPNAAPLVLPCLYRYADYPNTTMQLSPECTGEIRRVMHQRAVSVDLQPEVEDTCLEDLASFCYTKTQKGEETLCLQQHLEVLKKDCKAAVTRLTERQSKNIILNPYIRNNCGDAMQTFCSNELSANKLEGDIMECLITHKNHPRMREDTNCRAAIEHFQLIALKDYHFTYKFKEACKSYVVNYCPNAKLKSDMIECLSERILNDTIQGNWNTIKKECRQQVRAQLFHQKENIDLDPKLESFCKIDIKAFCQEIEHGGGRVLECLRSHSDGLSPQCHRAIFRMKKKEMFDSRIDYTLITACSGMVKQFCANFEPSKVLECLKTYKNDLHFDPTCKHVVTERMIDQNKDYRLNPALQAACQPDISRYCQDVVIHANDEKELNGKMIKCLKTKFREAKLKSKCETQMTVILREQALNYNLNPLLRTVCEKEIEGLCKPSGDIDDSTGEVEECLKNAFLQKKIVNGECKQEIASMIEEARADVHVDPLLQRACSLDIMKYCNHVDPGNSRQLNCLKVILSDPERSLSAECKEKLTLRMQMFDSADKVVQVESLRAIYDQVSVSPARRYFVIVAFSLVGFIFISGLMCGRITRRAIAHKNK